VSVDAFRQWIAKYGVIIFGIMLFAFILSSFSRCNRAGSGQADEVVTGPAIATIGNFKSTSLEVDQIANAQATGEMGPAEIAQAYGSSLSNVINHLYGLQVAADHGINMDDKAGVYRTETLLKEMEVELGSLHERYARVWVQDTSRRYNTDLLEAVELGFLLDLAEVVVFSARNRKESRGGHQRDDFPTRDDATYMKHTMAYLTGDPHSADAADHISLDWKPVVVTNYQPMERKY